MPGSPTALGTRAVLCACPWSVHVFRSGSRGVNASDISSFCREEQEFDSPRALSKGWPQVPQREHFHEPQEKWGWHFSNLVVLADLSSLYSSHSFAPFTRTVIKNCKGYTNAFTALKHGWTRCWLCLQFTECRTRGLGHNKGLKLTGKIFWGINSALWRAKRVRRDFIFPPQSSNVLWGLGKKKTLQRGAALNQDLEREERIQETFWYQNHAERNLRHKYGIKPDIFTPLSLCKHLNLE